MVLVSVVAAIMSFCYFSIGLGLGSAPLCFYPPLRFLVGVWRFEKNGKIAGSIIGYPAVSVANKLWLTFQALGDIAFAYPYELILLEIQDTVKSPPAENKVTKHASAIAILATSFFYLGCCCIWE
ncbi:putative amino acid transporter, transmembrane domain-containing protein [Helianthus annuus]|uniref:Amino acid transporter, transmembrane domain-containing protein n=1 Tax=Helianthus annuus TaxID=4232 RepID=A0A9K3IWJ3_HELAN|nr:putative amino acid transporter, transmembrane domain-containing protein [Helianthus annuus]KAJ0561916.1 putative amino acid transporter, transmembrane domain-containing protein [Helianthus annuus]KAJ0574982.1 putative amino acid transporter, transmembrane domain-containing protein [Helianthus annuus]KAJ0739312.1 putative amino acid transporter, transmembrane domain-containing protein [Helianthus annuus]KAJ0913615.1 putative amino acid transporter, transmembrane domain-containing protein [He